jgi:hypothetical protein
MIFSFLLLLLTLSLLGAYMSFIIDTRTSPIPANYLAYVPRPCPVVSHATRLIAVPCHNHATASAYASGRLPSVTAARTVAPRSAEQVGGCLTGGAGHDAAVTWVATGRVERVTNWASAKAIARNNPVTPEDKRNYLYWLNYSERLDVTA